MVTNKFIVTGIPFDMGDFNYKAACKGQKTIYFTLEEKETYNNFHTFAKASFPYDHRPKGLFGSIYCKLAHSEIKLLRLYQKYRKSMSKNQYRDLVKNKKKRMRKHIKRQWEYLDERNKEVRFYVLEDDKRVLKASSLKEFEQWVGFTQPSSAPA